MILRNSIIIFLLTFIYSLLRYNFFGNVPFADIPTLILNKAISFSSIIFLFLAILNFHHKNKKNGASYINFFKAFSLMHILLSIPLLNSTYYPKLFSGGRLSLYGNLALLTGVFSFAWLVSKKVGLVFSILFLLLAAHLFYIGSTNWLDFKGWYGSMPPITLICFLMVSGLFAFSFFNKNRLPEN